MEQEIFAHKHETAKSCLNDMARECKADITVVGYHGRKGPKADPTIMGSAVQFMSINSASPVMIIKDAKSRQTSPDGYFTLALCCDGSKKSLDALELMCKMRSGDDRIYVIICEQANIDSKKIKETVAEMLEDRECIDKADIQIIPSEPGRRSKDLIREHICDNKDLYIDYIFVGNKGADYSGTVDDYLGSVANEIIRHTKLNTVFMV